MQELEGAGYAVSAVRNQKDESVLELLVLLIQPRVLDERMVPPAVGGSPHLS